MTKKYNIEGNINFFEELNSKNNNEDNFLLNDKCYITYEPLDENSITLSCNHSFNYKPLFYTLYNELYRPTSTSKIIHCPYCRKPQSNKYCLTYIPELIDVFVYGVNTLDLNKKTVKNFSGVQGHINEIIKCQYGYIEQMICTEMLKLKYTSEIKEDNTSEIKEDNTSEIKEDNTFTKCFDIGLFKYKQLNLCGCHFKLLQQNNQLSYKNNLLMKKVKKDEELKKKLDIKEELKKQKEELKKQKEAEKIAKKEELKKQKEAEKIAKKEALKKQKEAEKIAKKEALKKQKEEEKI